MARGAQNGWGDGPTAGAIFVDGGAYELIVNDVNRALVDMNAAGGGTVFVPANAGIPITTTPISIPNRVRLCGLGAYGSQGTFRATASTNVSAMITNTTQDGTQQYAYLEHVQVAGNKALGATVTAGVLFKSIYVGSRLKDVTITNCSGNGLKLDGGTTQGLGQIMLDNISVANCNDDNILITGPCQQVYAFQLDSESTAAGKAQIRITNSQGVASFGHVLMGLDFEGTTAADGLVLDGCAATVVIGIVDNGSGASNNLVKITGAVGGSDGVFAAAGHVIIGALANLTTIIDDQVAGVTVGNAQGRTVRYYASPVSSATLDKSQMIGIQSARAGVSAVATGTMSISDGNYFVISGSTQITNINTAMRDAGRAINLTFSGTPIVATGGNLKLNSQFTAAANTVLHLVSDGTNWWGGRLS